MSSTATSHRNLAIILGAALGSLTISLLLGSLCYLHRRQSRCSLLTRRCVTPLSDAEFESWRRPSKQIQWREKFADAPTFPASPPPALTRFPSNRPRRSARPASLATLEKDARLPVYEHRARPIRAPDGFRAGERGWADGHRRCKSSMSTIQSVLDRPPTPYSPTGSLSMRPLTQTGAMASPAFSSMGSARTGPRLDDLSGPGLSETGRRMMEEGRTRVSSMSPKMGHVHYPSVSEASDFDFGFRADGAYGKI